MDRSFGSVRNKSLDDAGIGGNYVTKELKNSWLTNKTHIYFYGAKYEPDSAYGDRFVFFVSEKMDVQKADELLMFTMAATDQNGRQNVYRKKLHDNINANAELGDPVGPAILVAIPVGRGQYAHDFVDPNEEAPTTDEDLPWEHEEPKTKNARSK